MSREFLFSSTMPAERSKKLQQTTLDGKPAPTRSQPSSGSKSRSKSSKDAPGRVFTDVVLPIKTEFVQLISKREKNHEYRSYQMRPTVERLWFYETAPASAITYVPACTFNGLLMKIVSRHVMQTAKPKTPGQVCDPSGVGNDDFDAGLKKSKYGYPVLELWKLKTPVTAHMLKDKFGLSIPQSFCFATQDLVDAEKLDDMEKLF